MALNVRKESGRVRVRTLSRCSNKGVRQKQGEQERANDRALSHPLPRTRKWSELSIDVCHLIAEKINFKPHLHKFALGCKMWNTIAKEILDKNSILPPLLFLPYNEKTKTCRFTRPDCHSKFYDLKVSELKGQWICGCTKGWLAIMDDKNFDLALYNPIIRVKVFLPRFDQDIIKGHLKIYPKSYSGQRHPTTWPRFAAKIAISNNPDPTTYHSKTYSDSAKNCLVGVIFTHDHRLAICRLGDDSWSTVTDKGQPIHCFSDLVFYEGKLYAVNIHHVVVVDYKGPKNLSIKKVMTPWRDPETVLQTYIVMSAGNLLVVERYWLHESWIRSPIMTDDFVVYKMDPETQTWSEIENLQGQSLFLGLNSSMSISASDKSVSPWCRENCIYFLDDSELRYGLQYRGYQWDNGIFSMNESCVVHTFRIEHSITFWHTSALWYFQNIS